LNPAPKKIFVVLNRAIGDSVFGLSAISYLKSVYPETHITYAIPAWTAELYKEVEIAADEVFPLDLKSAKGYMSLIKELSKKRYDVVIELQQAGRSRKFFNVFKLAFGFRYVYHNHHLKKGDFVFEQGVRKEITQRHLDTCYSFVRTQFKSCSYPKFLNFPPSIWVKNHHHDARTIIFGIVASKQEKKWPVAYFGELAEKLIAKHGELKFIVPLSKSESDQKAKKELSEAFPHILFNFVELPLSKLPVEMAKGSIYIGNDTGLKHICAALGLKTVTFFGPEEPLEWHPYDYQKHPYFWPRGYDLRSKMAPLCLLQQFENSFPLSELKADVVFNSLEDKHLILPN
jgi:heptosyltransferase-2